MSENKKKFTEAMSTAMVIDQDRSGVKSIEYITDVNVKEEPYNGELYKEIVRIEYIGGLVTLINVEANSNGAIAKEIISEVYGDGAVGTLNTGRYQYKLIFDLREEEREEK